MTDGEKMSEDPHRNSVLPRLHEICYNRVYLSTKRYMAMADWFGMLIWREDGNSARGGSSPSDIITHDFADLGCHKA